jgi:SAM-dependent methyltransferase
MDEWAGTFDRDAAGYAHGRPGYPAEVFAVLEARCGLGPGAEVVEIGPGTGQATRELLARGARVHAVEPGARLATHLRKALADDALSITVSTFERVELAPASADLVVAATSFHWIAEAPGVPKAVDLLRPGGWVALWWNVFHDPDGPDAFSRALEPLFAAIGDRESPHGGARALDEGHWLELFRDAGLEDAESQRIEWEVEHETDDLVALFSTFSGTRARPKAERIRLLDGIRAVADLEFGGRLRRRYVTPLYTARKPTATSRRRS